MARTRWTRAKKERIKRILWVCAGTLTVTVGVGAAVYVIGFSRFGRTEAVIIEGARITEKKEIRRAIEKTIQNTSLRAQLVGPAHLLFWKEGRLDIEQELPVVEITEVRRDLRGRSIYIRVREKQVAGVWCGARSCWAHTTDGEIFAQTANASGYLIPKITDKEEEGKIGKNIIEHTEWLKNIQSITRNVRGIVSITSRLRREWEIETPEGTRLLFALDAVPQNLPEVLEEVYEKNKGVEMQTIDFRVPNKIYIK